MMRRPLISRPLIITVGMLLLGWSARARQNGNTAATPAAVPATSSSASPAMPAGVPATTPIAAPPPARPSNAASASSAPSSSAAASVREDEALRIEGEKRFATNCGRCHQSPHHFPPRMIATAVRHMRVRATITDEDMRLILRYLTQ